MTKTTPADLAVTFRSLARRQREATGDADPSTVAGLVNELQRHVDAAAAAIGAPADAESVAAVIERRPADLWDDATLDELRRQALDAGSVLRRIAVAAESESD